MSVDELLKEMLEQIPKMRSNESFLVKDLFRGYEWSRIPKADREALGEAFSAIADGELEPIVVKYDRTSSNQQKYKIR